MNIPRKPNQTDLLALAKALAEFQVEYVVIGGAAMALHGFPRMTKDIDLFLPVNASNNSRLLRALESMPENKEALSSLRPEWMDKGHSTELAGGFRIDLLYKAASKTFDELREHVQTVVLAGVPVVTLDIDGMLMSKQTTRESDIPDRLKLGRLKTAQRELQLTTKLKQADEYAQKLHPTDLQKQDDARRAEALRLGLTEKDYDRLRQMQRDVQQSPEISPEAVALGEVARLKGVREDQIPNFVKAAQDFIDQAKRDGIDLPPLKRFDHKAPSDPVVITPQGPSNEAQAKAKEARAVATPAAPHQEKSVPRRR